jgi:hypothetical protein
MVESLLFIAAVVIIAVAIAYVIVAIFSTELGLKRHAATAGQPSLKGTSRFDFSRPAG